MLGKGSIKSSRRKVLLVTVWFHIYLPFLFNKSKRIRIALPINLYAQRRLNRKNPIHEVLQKLVMFDVNSGEFIIKKNKGKYHNRVQLHASKTLDTNHRIATRFSKEIKRQILIKNWLIYVQVTYINTLRFSCSNI